MVLIVRPAADRDAGYVDAGPIDNELIVHDDASESSLAKLPSPFLQDVAADRVAHVVILTSTLEYD